MTFNLFENLPQTLPEELVEKLLETNRFRLERIVSTGQISPPDFWYDQEEDEWVVVLQGEAMLQIFGEDQPRQLRPGDTLFLPAHCRHRIVYTSTNEPTVWLALFYFS